MYQINGQSLIHHSPLSVHW